MYRVECLKLGHLKYYFPKLGSNTIPICKTHQWIRRIININGFLFFKPLYGFVDINISDGNYIVLPFNDMDGFFCITSW